MRKYRDAAGVEQEYGYNALPALLIGGVCWLNCRIARHWWWYFAHSYDAAFVPLPAAYGYGNLDGWIGARISRRIGSVLLIRIMCGTLLLFAVRMIIT
ncbi:hypothetical protein [Paenibacillus albus]